MGREGTKEAFEVKNIHLFKKWLDQKGRKGEEERRKKKGVKCEGGERGRCEERKRKKKMWLFK